MKKVALTPPKGWNSWDIYGASVTEEEVRSNARVMADKLKIIRLGLRCRGHTVVRTYCSHIYLQYFCLCLHG